LTTFQDLPSIIAGLHDGSIQASVQKPIAAAELLAAIRPTRQAAG